MDNTLGTAQIHRFHDFAAIYVRGKKSKPETVYLSAKQARELATALLKVADSIEKEDFAKSSGLTQYVEGAAS